MTAWALILRSAGYYWRTHLGVILGAALGAMVLTGALLVGDSVKATLQQQALARVGKADVALTGADRFFHDQLAAETNPEAAPVVLVRGSVARADGSARVNQAQVLGVDERFWKLAPGAAATLPPDQIALNERLAAQLGAKVGDTLVMRIEKPGLFSRDAPLSGDENEVVAIRAKVGAVVGDSGFGRFGLQASQIPPFTVFAPLKTVQAKLGLAGKANLLLSKNAAGGAALPSLTDLEKPWDLADASLELREPPKSPDLELRTPRVFLDPSIAAAAPPATNGHRVEALTYFVNELRAGDQATPYSMVTAVDPAASGFLPADLAADQIVISQWLAEDLGVAVGGEVSLKYYVMGERRQLAEKTRSFKVVAVLPMDQSQLNTSWMPDFPGLSDKANCRDWKPGFDFDSRMMRDKDQAYWEKYRGTPKAFINLQVGQEMWSNRWGNLTSIRWPAGTDRAVIEKELRAKLSPAALGFQLVPLREQALAATDAPVDFGELFVSFSFFLIIAAAALTGMLFVFSLEQRNAEAGLLLALGLGKKRVRRLFLAEGTVLAVVGSVIGAVGGIIYTKLVLKALVTVWQGAVGSTQFLFVLPPETLITGIFSGILVALLAMWLASRWQLRHSARELLTGEVTEPVERGRSGTIIPFAVAAVSGLGAAALLFTMKGAEAFFSAGSLLLIAGLAFGLGWLRRLAGTATEGLQSLNELGTRNTTRRRGRSLATIAVLASGVFMVVAVDSFRHPAPKQNATSDPGTGGFALIGESALPIYEDLNTAKGRDAYGLSDEVMRDVRVVPMRVRDGDDASCLNLNRPLQPRLAGVNPEDLASRNAFRFSDVASKPYAGVDVPKPDDSAKVWQLLNRQETEEPTVIPSVADQNTLEYSLKMDLGGTIEYRDERGQPFRVRIVAAVAGSILQGQLLIAESRFIEKLPNNGGYRYFLIDCPPVKTAAVRAELSRALTDRGMELTTTAQRLGEFQTVENTYLAIFQALGGLGLLLGSAGLAIVVGRNVLERRREFGLLAAVGFRPRQLRQLVFAEHRWLIIAALVIGTASALLGVWPNLAAKAGGFPFREVALLLAGLAIGCLFWTWLATRLALRGSGVKSLRTE